MKRIVLLFGIAIGIATGASAPAHAQRSGSLQVTAHVVDTRESWAGLTSARNLASHLANFGSSSQADVSTPLANISIQLAAGAGALDRPRRAAVTINYLRL